ncbi:MAG: 16S rRNA (guanine(966)-N(2))-methyltransferase RsmD [Lachnospiraceae bacterium]|nr:16S rRNA (guanine(966)-N(2))-methyltransferase RsmD [Lachnospiraceae bacterium]
MRVIAGTAKSLQLKAPKGMDTRPTTDRIKETLFNMIWQELYDVSFLDLFSGSGGIGIEALSRGASHAVFVEKNKEACDIIRQNLETTHFTDKSSLMCCSAVSAIEKLACKEKFSVVFMDPPYNTGLEKEILLLPSFSEVLEEKALIIIEADIKTDFSEEDYRGFRFLKEKTYKTNKHVFLEKA